MEWRRWQGYDCLPCPGLVSSHAREAEQLVPPPPPQADLSISETKLESASYGTYDIEVINLLLQINLYNVAN